MKELTRPRDAQHLLELIASKAAAAPNQSPGPLIPTPMLNLQ